MIAADGHRSFGLEELKMNSPSRIYLSPPDMSSRERELLLDAFDSNWIAPVGPALTEFESGLCDVAGTEAAVAVVSGTAALHLGLLALGVSTGDIVIVPTLTFIATANAVRYVGAVPHFVDCDPRTGNIDPDALEKALSHLHGAGHRAKAVVTVDLYGSCANYEQITPICSKYAVPILEDAAEAIGATHNGAPAGSFGRLGVFSFNGNKLVTTGGGGALVGPRSLIDRARHLASQARLPERHFEHSDVGYAYRMSNLLAAVGSAQLQRLDQLINRTRQIHYRYMEALHHLPGVDIIRQDGDGRGNGWLTVIMTDPGRHVSPSRICEILDSRYNIEARPAWKPLHLQSPYQGFTLTGGDEAVRHFSRGLCLPSGSSMTDDEQQRVIDSLIHILRPHTDVIDLDRPQITAATTRQHQDNPAPTQRAA